MALKDRRVLFISYNGMLDPLGQSQVIPYLRELSREGVRFTLLSFERADAYSQEGIARCESLRQQLAAHDIDWHWLRYHQRPSLPATVYDVAAGVNYARKLIRRNRIEMVHARSHIPATIALCLKKLFPLKMIFDVRGLMAEEYVDAEHWREGGLPFRLTKRAERSMLRATDGVVTLTERIWPIIKKWEGLRDRHVAHQVIPCCANLEVFKFDAEARARRREELNLCDRFTLVYSGSIGGWYMTDKMADFFVELLKRRTDAHFLWLTPARRELIDDLMSERGLSASQYTVLRAASADVPSYLSASDAGIAFYKPGFSKLATSPVKVTEYLACGLPFVINAGVGDSDELVTRERVGAMVRDFNAEEYARVAEGWMHVMEDKEGARQHAREVARRLFDLRGVGLERYARLYEEVLESD